MKTRQETASQWYNSNKYNEEKLTLWDVWRISFTWGMILTWIVGAMSACSEQQWTYTQGPNTAERLHNANYDLSGNTRLILRQVQKVRSVRLDVIGLRVFLLKWPLGVCHSINVPYVEWVSDKWVVKAVSTTWRKAGGENVSPGLPLVSTDGVHC